MVGDCEDCGPGLLDLCPWEERVDEEAESMVRQTYGYVNLDYLPKPNGGRKKKGQNGDAEVSKPT